MHTDVSDISQASHAEHSGYGSVKAVWSKHRRALLAARDALVETSGSALNPSGAVELRRLIEAIDRQDAIYR